MKRLENLKDCHLVIWETNPKKRNINNIIKFYVPFGREVNVGDVITGSTINEMESQYTILQIIERRPASMIGREYISAATKFAFKQV